MMKIDRDNFSLLFPGVTELFKLILITKPRCKIVQQNCSVVNKEADDYIFISHQERTNNDIR